MADIKEAFRKVVEQLDEDDRNALLLEIKDKKLTGKELVDAIRELPPEERAAVRDAFLSVADDDRSLKPQAKQLEKDAEHDEESRSVEEDKKEVKTEETKRKTRPGRKNGRAYGWYVDEKGRVKVSQVAQVYSGDDEPDEVELYDQDEDEDEDLEDEDA